MSTCNQPHTGSTNILIDGLALTDPRFSQYPMLLSLLKFHSLSNENENTNSSSSAAAVGVHNTDLSDNKDRETEV